MAKIFYFFLCLVIASQSLEVTAQQSSDTGSKNVSAKRDGQHDFDFEIDTWKTHLGRLPHPLSGSSTWIEYDGATVVRKMPQEISL
ncbi:MAG TPA: hypothetical protein VGQ55_01505 [Pyrinomonadaceae bacterium]|jgi:hypothetical protein|nr:hypothetical protein [Pyrinomonadaceae bacterium]